MIFKNIVFCILIIVPSIYSNELFIGVPKFKLYSDGENVQHHTLNEKEKEENAVVILESEDGILWKTRNSTTMNKSISGEFTIYTASNGSGYLKLNNQTGEFIEHVHLNMQTITYWGWGKYKK